MDTSSHHHATDSHGRLDLCEFRHLTFGCCNQLIPRTLSDSCLRAQRRCPTGPGGTGISMSSSSNLVVTCLFMVGGLPYLEINAIAAAVEFIHKTHEHDLYLQGRV